MNLEKDELTPNDLPRLARHFDDGDQKKTPQLDFFAQQEKQIREKIEQLDINAMTPIQALTTLNELKKIVTDRHS